MSLIYPNTFHYDFTSPINTVHVVAHNLGDLRPLVQVIRDDNNEVIVPSSVVITDANTVTINLFVARAVRGKVTHGRIAP
jgi:hypothetical protein